MNRVLNSQVRLKRLLLLAVGLILAFASLGLVDQALTCGGCVGPPYAVKFKRAFTNDDGVVNDSKKDAGDNGVDPGNGKRVATCLAKMESDDKVKVTITNAYPAYTCRVWVKFGNTGCKSIHQKSRLITAPPELTVTDVSPQSCSTLKPGDELFEAFDVRIKQSARQAFSYQFTISTKFTEATK
jgi:hypothetical protein